MSRQTWVRETQGNTIHQIKYVNRDLRQKTQSILSFNLNSQCQHQDLRTTAKKID